MKKHIGIIGGGAAGMMGSQLPEKVPKLRFWNEMIESGKKYYRQETENAIWAIEISRWNVTMEEMLHG